MVCDILCDMSARALRGLIGQGDVSPVEVLSACVERIQLLNPKLNAFTTTCFDRAFYEAKEAEKVVVRGEPLGALHGLPIGIKDLNETAGVCTTYGSRLYKDHVPEFDDQPVRAIRASGGIIVGKTNTPEFGSGAVTDNLLWGPTGNPFDPNLTCGGSSGGSAVAVATGMVPLASGNDFGASLRNPAGFCGVVGHRPTLGTVPYESRMAAVVMTVQGPMARSVDDANLLLRGMISDTMTDLYSPGPTGESDIDLDRLELSDLKIAVSDDLGVAPVDPDIRDVFRERVLAIESWFSACDWTHPELPDVHDAYEIYRCLHFYGKRRDLEERRGGFLAVRDQLHPNVVDNFERAGKLTPEEIIWCLERQSLYFRNLARFLDNYDILLCPVCAVSPFSIEQMFPSIVDGMRMQFYTSWTAITYALSMTLHPIVVIPCGTDRQGLPFGVQVVGKYRRDERLISIARELETAFSQENSLSRPVPDLSQLISANDIHLPS